MKFSITLLTILSVPSLASAFVPRASINSQCTTFGKSTRQGSCGMIMSTSNFSNNKSTTSLQSSTLLDPPKETVSTEESAPAYFMDPLKDMQTEVKASKSFLDDGFVFGLDGSGLERPKGKVSQVVVEGDSTETQPYQVAMVGTTMASHLAFMGYAISQISAGNDGDIVTTAAQAAALVASSWVAADFGSGVFHWSVDNYGNGRTPILGGIIAAFQGHHAAQWTITERGFCNNVYKLCIPFGIPTVALISAISSPHVTLFFAVFCTLEILSQELHKWSHMTKKEVPSYVNWLQNVGLSVNRVQHSQHHIAPYDGNYCIVSGLNNEWTDKTGFFRRLEHIVYNLNGVESNAWKLDPALREKTLRGDYSLSN